MTIYHWNKEEQRLVEGYPENPNPVYGQAPCVIFDSMPKTYHHAAEREVESRKEWNLLDKQYDTITFGNVKEARPKIDSGWEKNKYKQELRKASFTALQKWKENPKEMSQKLEKSAEAQMQVLKKSGIKPLLKQSGIKI